MKLLLLLLLCGYVYSEKNLKSPCCPGDNKLLGFKCLGPPPPDILNITGSELTKITLKCESGTYLIDPSIDPTEQFKIDQFGELKIGNISSSSPEHYSMIEYGKYCVSEKIFNITTSVPIALVCFPEYTPNYSLYILPIMLIVSIVCLVLTLLVYSLIPNMRDLQGICTMCLCAGLALGFLNLTLAQLTETIPKTPRCYIIAFGMYFWLIAAFFWMNIISINMMRTVLYSNSRKSDMRLFLYYNLYGWGVPFLLMICTIISEFKEGNHIKPGIGESCWFNGKVQTWAYFYAPIAILLVANILLFAFTSKALWYKTNYENVTKLRSMKYKFCLYIKLFLITGISWVFELISFASDSKPIAWMITDIFNALQGFIYLLVLVVLRKKALRGLAALGVPIPCGIKHNEDEEECDEIMGEEHVPSMTIVAS